MNKAKKPREFYVIYEEGYSPWITNKPLNSADVQEELHVLEAAPVFEMLDKLELALKFYTLKSNYSIVDEGRNYSVDYKCYELNEDTYADEELGTKAREALTELRNWRLK